MASKYVLISLDMESALTFIAILRSGTMVGPTLVSQGTIYGIVYINFHLLLFSANDNDITMDEGMAFTVGVSAFIFFVRGCHCV